MGEGRIFRDKLFWLTLVCGGFFLSVSLWFKFTMDQALCNYIAWVWKNYHLPPYLGVWDLSFPGIFILHRLIIEFFGESIFGFRLFDFLVQLSSVLMIYYLARRISGLSSSGFLAGVFYSIYYAGLGSLETGEREGYIFFLLLLSLIISLGFGNRYWLRAMLVGLMVGFGFLLKPSYGVCWVVFGIWFLAEGLQAKRSWVWLELFLYIFFCLVPLGLVALYYWRLGYVKELYSATILYNLEVYSGSSSVIFSKLSRIERILYVLHKDIISQTVIIFSSLVMIVVQIFGWRQVRDRKLFWGLISLLGVSIFSYWLQAKFFPYHLTPFIGLMTIFSGWFFGWVWSYFQGQVRDTWGRFRAGIFYLVLIILVILGNNYYLISYFAYDYLKPFEQVYSSGNSFDAQYYRVIKELEPLLRGESEIGYFGWHPLVPYLLKKKLPTRFCNVYHLLIRRKDGRLSKLQEKWIKEYTEAMIKTKPRFFLVADYVPGWDVFNLESPSLKDALGKEFPELKAFLVANYKLYTKDSVLEVYLYQGEE